MPRADWAYDFVCGQSIETILDAFNSSGPWRWEMRDRLHWGDYLRCRPKQGATIDVLKYPKRRGAREKRFKALLEIQVENPAAQSEIDDAFRRLLQAINATDVIEAKPYN